jgi:hypothetical protein
MREVKMKRVATTTTIPAAAPPPPAKVTKVAEVEAALVAASLKAKTAALKIQHTKSLTTVNIQTQITELNQSLAPHNITIKYNPEINPNKVLQVLESHQECPVKGNRTGFNLSQKTGSKNPHVFSPAIGSQIKNNEFNKLFRQYYSDDDTILPILHRGDAPDSVDPHCDGGPQSLTPYVTFIYAFQSGQSSKFSNTLYRPPGYKEKLTDKHKIVTVTQTSETISISTFNEGENTGLKTFSRQEGVFSLTFHNWDGGENGDEKLLHDVQVVVPGKKGDTRVNIVIQHRKKPNNSISNGVSTPLSFQ